jgi:hypothetical protein
LTLPLLLLLVWTLVLLLSMNSARFNSSMHTHAGSLLLLPPAPAALLFEAWMFSKLLSTLLLLPLRPSTAASWPDGTRGVLDTMTSG